MHCVIDAAHASLYSALSVRPSRRDALQKTIETEGRVYMYISFDIFNMIIDVVLGAIIIIFVIIFIVIVNFVRSYMSTILTIKPHRCNLALLVPSARRFFICILNADKGHS